MSIDETKLNNFLGKAVGDLGAAIGATLMLVGDRLGRLREVVVSGGGSADLDARRKRARPRRLPKVHGCLSAGELSCTGFQDLSGSKRSIFWNASRVPGPKSFS